jgi:hypothetical protein
MLTNTDFADLLKSSDANGLSSDKKIRFDLKQVKVWDKQNDASGKRKPKKKESSGKVSGGINMYIYIITHMYMYTNVY